MLILPVTSTLYYEDNVDFIVVVILRLLLKMVATVMTVEFVDFVVVAILKLYI